MELYQKDNNLFYVFINFLNISINVITNNFSLLHTDKDYNNTYII